MFSQKKPNFDPDETDLDRRRRDFDFQQRMLAANERHWFWRVVNSAAFIAFMSFFFITLGGFTVAQYQACESDFNKTAELIEDIVRERSMRRSVIKTLVQTSNSIDELRNRLERYLEKSGFDRRFSTKSINDLNIQLGIINDRFIRDFDDLPDMPPEFLRNVWTQATSVNDTGIIYGFINESVFPRRDALEFVKADADKKWPKLQDWNFNHSYNLESECWKPVVLIDFFRGDKRIARATRTTN